MKKHRLVSALLSAVMVASAALPALADDTAATFVYDRYGQYQKADYPEKVKSDEDLKNDLAADQAYYDGLTVENRDEWGGLAGSGEQYGLTATGHFHVETIPDSVSGDGEKTVLVSPAGNLYFSLGTCVTDLFESYTTVEGREEYFEWVPEKGGEFDTAFSGGQFSYYIANRIKKTGEPFDAASWYDEMVERLKKWGFTGVGCWSRAADAQRNQFPYVVEVKIAESGISRFGGPGYEDMPDAFAPDFEQKIMDYVASAVAGNKDDPALIGYFFGNEYHYNNFNAYVPQLANDVPVKQEFIRWMTEKYGTVDAFNAVWETEYTNFDEINKAPLNKEGMNDMYAFFEHYLDTFFGIINKAFRAAAPDKLILGDRTNKLEDTQFTEAYARVAKKYLDVISFNYYAFDPNVEKFDLVHEISGKPLMITEFHFTEPTRGFTAGKKSVANEEERGFAYRNYVDGLADLGYIVGAHHFTLMDQPASGRGTQGIGGEAFACGLLDVADRPYKTMMESIKATNDNIYAVMMGEAEPFTWKPDVAERVEKQPLEIPRALGEIAIDGVLLDTEWPYMSYAPQITAGDQVDGQSMPEMGADFRLAWDEENLYVFASILDRTPMVNARTGSGVWGGDGIEIFVGGQDVDEEGPIMVTDRQLIISGGLSADGNMNYWFYNTGEQTEIEMMLKEYSDGLGYTIEAAIPWSGLNVDDIREGRRIRIDVGLDNADEGTRSAQWMWSGGAGNNADRTGWQTATLVAEAGAPSEHTLEVTPGSIEAVVDGATVSMAAEGVAPFLQDGRILIPLRAVAGILGATVGWNADENKITLQKDGSTVYMWTVNNIVSVDGTEKEMDVSPTLVEGRTMLPLRYVSEAFGCTTEWDPDAGKATITFMK